VLRRVAVTVPVPSAEEARALLLELLPEGFEEVDHGDTVELAGYVGTDAERRLRAVFGSAESEAVPEDWADRWRSFHHAVRVGSLWVGPPWEPAPDDATAIVIDPGRAFGTGAHPTTRLSLELLQELRPGSLIDVGCGSGVIAIAAVKLGFTVVDVLDIDSVATETAAENAARNGVELPIRAADALTARLPPADVAVANIALDVVAALAPRLVVHTLVTSGYLETEQPELPPLRHVGRRTVDGWAADLYRRV
jgi:ribosomal protein L11 methyltransferase